jgi:hypothetical protein
MNDIKATPTARVHRFRDLVAVSFPGLPTVYLTDAIADDLGAELLLFADDVRKSDFARSDLRSIDIGGEQ